MMKKSSILFAMLCILTVISSFAQDKIYKTNGEVLDVKVKNVGPTSVIYQYRDNINGPEYTILKSEIYKIHYKNGAEDEFATEHINTTDTNKGNLTKNFERIKYDKKNLLAFAPFQFTENGVGISISYEKTLDKRGLFTFYLPVLATFNLSNDAALNHGSDPLFYIMPGFKYYPNGCWGNSVYAIGPSVVLAAGSKTQPYNNYYNNPPYTEYNTSGHYIFGMIINNSVNFNPTEKIYLGLEFGIGFDYINSIDGVNKGLSGLVQGSFKIGFRY